MGYWRQGFDAGALPEELQELGVSRSFLDDGLSSFSHLTELRALDLRDGYPKDTMKALSGMTRLIRLHVENVSAGWSSMAGCTALEEVDMTPRLANFRPFKDWVGLRALTVRGRGVRTLDGIERFEHLESLTFHGTRIRDFSALLSLTKVREISAFHGAAADTESGEQFRRALCQSPSLRRYRTYLIEREMVDELRSAHPGIEVLYDGTYEKREAQSSPGENVTVQPPEDGVERWSIFESLAERFCVATNYAAEEALKKALRTRCPDVLSRLEWDTESDNVSVSAADETDIQAVAAVANEIIVQKSRR